MFDWIGSLKIRERSTARVVLVLSRSTQAFGVLVLALGLVLAFYGFRVSAWLGLVPALLAGLGVLLVTLRRELTIDREAGILRVDQRAFGIASRTVVPLFHLRAVVVVARPPTIVGKPPVFPTSRYVAYLDRRVGQAIFLDEARRCAGLLRLAEVVADVAELRLEWAANSSMTDDP